jgi:hypothetical protein
VIAACDVCHETAELTQLGDLYVCSLCLAEHVECANHCGTVIHSYCRTVTSIDGEYYCDECIAVDDDGNLYVRVLE